MTNSFITKNDSPIQVGADAIQDFGAVLVLLPLGCVES
jgi:hypothetical protein